MIVLAGIVVTVAAPLHLQEDALVFERPLSLVVGIVVAVAVSVAPSFPKHVLPPVATPPVIGRERERGAPPE